MSALDSRRPWRRVSQLWSARVLAPTTNSHDETIQTTTNHPWLTAHHGWILASFLRVGELVRRVDGSTAMVVAVRAEPGAAAMWDLTVSNVHTFAVGDGAYVVHNCPSGEGGGYQTKEIVSKQYDSSKEAFDEVSRQLGGTDDLTEVTTFSHGPYKDLPNGRASADGARSWRLDYDPNTSKGLHFNWMDATAGGKGSGARWGAVRMFGNERTFDSMAGSLLDEGIEGMLR